MESMRGEEKLLRELINGVPVTRMQKWENEENQPEWVGGIG